MPGSNFGLLKLHQVVHRETTTSTSAYHQTLAARVGHSPAGEPFAHACRVILRAWGERVLGPRPSDGAAQTALANIGRWICGCTHCTSAHTHLTNGKAEQIRLLNIGAVARKHVEQNLALYAWSAATYETIRQSPQGLEVRWTIEIPGFRAVADGV